MKKLTFLAVFRMPVYNSCADIWRKAYSEVSHPIKILAWIILLIGIILPEFALANGCVGTGPCYCTPGTSVCSNEAPSNNSSGSSSGGGYTPQQQMILNGAQTMMPLLQQGVHDLIYGNPQEDARRQAEAAGAAELQRQAAEQRKLEEMRQMELAKQRILKSLKGAEPPTGLALKMEGSDSTLIVNETRGAFGSTVVAPVRIDTPPTERGLQLKLGDDAERSSMQASQGFDTNGKIMGSNLPPPPPAPKSASPDEKLQLLNALRASLKRNVAEEQLLRQQLEQLQQSPTPDPITIGAVQEKIALKETEKKKIILDLTADDPDLPPSDKGSAK